MNAIGEVFGQTVVVSGCYFHFTQVRIFGAIGIPTGELEIVYSISNITELIRADLSKQTQPLQVEFDLDF